MSDRHTVTLPPDVVVALDLEKGGWINFEVRSDHVRVKRIVMTEKETVGSGGRGGNAR